MTSEKHTTGPLNGPPAPELRGVQLKAVYTFIKQRYGNATVDAALKSLGPEDQSLIPGLLLDSNWYSYSAWRVVTRMMRVLDPHAGEEFCVEAGTYMADYCFVGAFRSLVTNSPAQQIDRFNRIHYLGVRNVSDIDAHAVAADSATVTYRYKKDVRTAVSTCATLRGFWSRLLEMSGAKDVVAMHNKCAARGADRCEFVFNWK
ncbi:MAG TPA: hypothetical protein VI756_29100 [Blastocatellia bacterium]